MPRIAKGTGKVRLNLEMSETVRHKLEDLQRRTDAPSLSEVIRKALAVYDLVWSAVDEGRQIVIRDDDGAEQTVILVG
jgi:hypothetical protein